MLVKIYGRQNCPYCDKAKALAEQLSQTVVDFQYEYIDISVAGLNKEDLSKMAGKAVTTVPQIFIDGIHVGGYTDFASLSTKIF